MTNQLNLNLTNQSRVRKMGKMIALLSTCLIVSSCGGQAKTASVELTAQQEKIQQIVESRIRNFKDMGAAFKGISDDLKAGNPGSTTVLYSAKSLARITKNMESWFPEGSGAGVGVKTSAKPAIWAQDSKFAAIRAEFQLSITALYAAAETGDGGAIKAGFYKAAKGCKTCHDLYREEK